MEEWMILTKNKAFISDLGQSPTVTAGGAETRLGRYAVWSPVKENTGHRVIEVGDNLTALRRKYRIPADLVLRLITKEAQPDG